MIKAKVKSKKCGEEMQLRAGVTLQGITPVE
jgi:hypothetical protein